MPELCCLFLELFPNSLPFREMVQKCQLLGISSLWIHSRESDSHLYLPVKSLYREPPLKISHFEDSLERVRKFQLGSRLFRYGVGFE